MGSFIYLNGKVVIRIHEDDILSYALTRVMDQSHEKVAKKMEFACTYKGKEYPVLVSFDAPSLWFDITCSAFDEILNLCRPV